MMDAWFLLVFTLADLPAASARCSLHNGLPRFERPQKVQCSLTLNDIEHDLVDQAELETLATSAQILTSRPEQLTADNVTAAAKIANILLRSANATEEVRVAAVATISQLLNASALVNTEENTALSSLTSTLDQLSLNQSLNLNKSQSQVVQPNLVIQSAQIPSENTQGVQFTSLAAVHSQSRPSNVSLGFVLYQNDNFFRSRLYKKQHETSIRVLSANIQVQQQAVVPQHVEMLFRPTVIPNTTLYDYACVFWDHKLNDWSTIGCSKGNAEDGVLRCFCNHTTNFAALVSFRENHEYAEVLSYISTLGLSFSIVGLMITIVFHMRESYQRKRRENATIVLMSVCISLLAFIIIFLFGVNNNKDVDAEVEVTNTKTNNIPRSDVHVEGDRGSCTAVAALLQFFLLATFVWNALYSTQLMLLIQKTRRSLPPSCTALTHTAGWDRDVQTKTSRPRRSDRDVQTKTSRPRRSDRDVQTKTSRPRRSDRDVQTKTSRPRRSDRDVQTKTSRPRRSDRDVQTKTSRPRRSDRDVQTKTSRPRRPDQDVQTKTFRSRRPDQDVQTKTSRPRRPDQDVQIETSRPRRSDRDVQTKTSRPRRSDRDVQTKTFRSRRPDQDVQTKTFRSRRPDQDIQTKTFRSRRIPAVVVAITLGTSYRVNQPLDYRREEFCWLAALDHHGHFDFKKPMFWGFLLPVGLILVYNIMVLIYFSLKTCRTNPTLTSTRKSSIWKKFLSSFSLAVLLGLSWTLGYLVLSTKETAHFIFSIVFCICTTTQGLQVFILFTARKPSFRKLVSQSFQQVSAHIHVYRKKYILNKSAGSDSRETYKGTENNQDSANTNTTL
ncbi:adhesion G-protein coupled receptor G7 [Diretmus argenteus]